MSKLEALADCYDDVCSRIEFANMVGLDLTFQVSCVTCKTSQTMKPYELLAHIEQHIQKESRQAA